MNKENAEVEEKSIDEKNNNDINKTKKTRKIENKKEYMKEYMKKYQKNNMEKWMNFKECSECGHNYRSSNVSSHQRSNKHKFGMMEKELQTLRSKKEQIIKNDV